MEGVACSGAEGEEHGDQSTQWPGCRDLQPTEASAVAAAVDSAWSPSAASSELAVLRHSQVSVDQRREHGGSLSNTSLLGTLSNDIPVNSRGNLLLSRAAQICAESSNTSGS